MPYTKSNDSYDKVYYRATTRSGEVIDLTGASIQFKMESRKGELLVNSPGTILNATNGEMEYQLQEVDTIISGVHRAEFTITFSDGKEKTVPEDGYIQVTITSDIDTNRDTEQQEAVAIYVSEIEAFKTDINATVDDYGVRLDAVETEQVDQDLRIDNIVAQSGTDNTEQVDARLGADGIARNVMGELIREIHKEQILANKDKKTLVHGLNIITSDTASNMKVEFYGEHRVNLWGKTGKLFDGWSLYQGTKVINGEWAEFTIDTGSTRVDAYKDYQVQAGKYYLFAIEGENIDATSIKTVATSSEMSSVHGSDVTKGISYIKLSPATSHSVRLYARVNGSEGQKAKVRYGRLISVSQETYDKIGVSLTDADVERLFPYVDGIQGVKNPVLKVSGQNFVVGFPSWEDKNNVPYTITSNYEIKIDGSSKKGSVVDYRFKAVSSQAYTFKGLGSASSNAYVIYEYNENGTESTIATITDELEHSFTTKSTTREVRVLIYTYANGTFVMSQPMLNLGSTALPFTEKNDSHLMAETTLYGNDVKKDILSRNESLDVPRWEVKREFKDTDINQVLDVVALSNVDVFLIYDANQNITFNNYLTDENETLLIEVPNDISEKDNVENVGKYYTITSGEVYLIVAKGTDPTTFFTDKNYFLLYQLASPVTEYAPKHFTVEGDLSIQGDAQIEVTSGFSYTTDSEGNRTYTLTPESERYSETCNLTEVIAKFNNSLKSTINSMVGKQSDQGTTLSIHARQLYEMQLEIDALKGGV